MSPRFPRNAILLGLLALAAAPQTFAEGTNPEDQSFELGQITITGRRTRSKADADGRQQQAGGGKRGPFAAAENRNHKGRKHAQGIAGEGMQVCEPE